MSDLETFTARHGTACSLCGRTLSRREITSYAYAVASGIPSVGMHCADRPACHERVTEYAILDKHARYMKGA